MPLYYGLRPIITTQAKLSILGTKKTHLLRCFCHLTQRVIIDIYFMCLEQKNKQTKKQQ